MDVRAIHTTDLDDWRGDTQSQPFQDLLRALSAMIAVQRASQPAVQPKPVAPGSTSALSAAGSLSAAKPARVTICVLPFANMSGDQEQEYFSDGISEDIITDLSKVSALAVVSRNTAFTFKGKNVDVSQVARQLKVGYVLEGSVRKAGGRVRISAQLIEGANDNHIWAERYDRDLNDIFALQDEISQAIVKGGMAALIALLTHTAKVAVKGAKPYEPPGPGMADAVASNGLVVRVQVEAIPQPVPASVPVALASKAVAVQPPSSLGEGPEKQAPEAEPATSKETPDGDRTTVGDWSGRAGSTKDGR